MHHGFGVGQTWVTGMLGKPLHRCSFLQIVDFAKQQAFQLVHDSINEACVRKMQGASTQCGQYPTPQTHIGSDGRIDAGVLNLDRQLTVRRQASAMNLTEAGCGKRVRLEVIKQMLGLIAE